MSEPDPGGNLKGPPDLASIAELCRRHLEIEQRQNRLRDLQAEVEGMLVERHAWFDLTRVQRRAIPAGQIMIEIEDELERLGRSSAQLVIDLKSVPATSVQEAIAKLQVVARVIDQDDYPEAHAVLQGVIAELAAVSGTGICPSSARSSYRPSRRTSRR